MNCQNHTEVPAHGILPHVRQADMRRNAAATLTEPSFAGNMRPAPAGEPSGRPGPGRPPPGYVYNGRFTRPGSFSGHDPGSRRIYNGQYAKGLVHAVIWGILMSIANSRCGPMAWKRFSVMLVLALVGLPWRSKRNHTALKAPQRRTGG